MTKKVYLDHAATTYLKPEVIEVMSQVMLECYGNPSSTHAVGREAKSLIEQSRKKVAQLIGAQSKEIIFNSGATEGNNWIIDQCIKNLKIKRIISSKMEHHAVLYPILRHQSQGIEVDFVNTNKDGSICLNHLEELLQKDISTLVSIMHINNETGIINNISKIGTLAKQYNAYFHSDMVQAVGKQAINLQDLPVDFMVATAHKFHGPKGVGFVYVKSPLVLDSNILGGEQEKGFRAGTEAVHQIVGLAKALEMSYNNIDKKIEAIKQLKLYAIEQLQKKFNQIKINGSIETSAYNILNVTLPLKKEKSLMLLFNLDLKGISVSRGSACQSGSPKPSHVLAEFLNEETLEFPSVRISFAENNTKDDIDYLIENL